MVIDAFIKKEESKAQQVKIALYNNAYLTSMFVGHVLGGKSIPKYEDVFKEELQHGSNDEVMEDSTAIARLQKVIEGEEEIEKWDKLLSLAITGGDEEWL